LDILLYLLLGGCTGLLAGLFGIGGGLIIVPTLVYVFGVDGFAPDALMPLAIGTSLAAIAATAVSSVFSHHRHGAVRWPILTRLTPGIVVGTVLGALAADAIGNTALRYVFSIFMLLAALQMVSGVSPRPGGVSGSPSRFASSSDGRVAAVPGAGGAFAAGAVIGAVSALVGIGGGTLTTPFLVWRGIALRNAIATSAACGLPIALTGAVGYVAVGAQHVGLPSGATGYVYWPAAGAIALASIFTAPLGAYLTHRLPVPLLKRAFALLMMVVAVRLMLH
jgi:uncharacterized membrane protein YfcA